MKNIHTLTNLMKIGSGLLFASSFFVKDNEKAVNRRYLSLGILGAGFLIDIASTTKPKKA